MKVAEVCKWYAALIAKLKNKTEQHTVQQLTALRQKYQMVSSKFRVGQKMCRERNTWNQK